MKTETQKNLDDELIWGHISHYIIKKDLTASFIHINFVFAIDICKKTLSF